MALTVPSTNLQSFAIQHKQLEHHQLVTDSPCFFRFDGLFSFGLWGQGIMNTKTGKRSVMRKHRHSLVQMRQKVSFSKELNSGGMSFLVCIIRTVVTMLQ